MADSEYERALGIALRSLRASDKLESDIRVRLAQKEIEATTIEEVVAFLHQKRFLNDAAYVEKLAAKGMSRAQIQAHLESKGADESLLDSLTPVQEVESAVKLLRAKIGKSNPDPAKAVRYLASRGFTEDQIRTAVQTVLGMDPD